MERDDIGSTVAEETYNFVELESLQKNGNGFYEWKERARWYKLEEIVEYGSERWSRPFVPSLPYKSVKELKQFILDGTVLLDVNEHSLFGIADRIVEAAVRVKAISERVAPMLHATFLARHHHQHQKEGVASKVVTPGPAGPSVPSDHEEVFIVLQKSKTLTDGQICEENQERIRRIGTATMLSPIALLTEDERSIDRNCSSIHHDRILAGGGETTTILVAELPFAKLPVALFVRLKESSVLGNLTEAELPVRFIYLVMGPASDEYDLYQVGRAVGALMSDLNFSNIAALAEGKDDLISGIDRFLSTSVLIPPGKWDTSQIHNSICRLSTENLSNSRIRRRTAACITDSVIDHFQRTSEDADAQATKQGKLFGSLVKDVQRKLAFYRSDFVDALQFRCLIAIIIMYFTFLVPAITFGALLSKVTNHAMCVAESIQATAISGVLFGFFAGQPLIVLGATGPLLVMEGSIYQLSVLIGADFLSWRVWIGIWITMFCLLIVAFDLTRLVRYLTPFTEEVLAALVSSIFIYESFKFLVHAYLDHQEIHAEGNSTIKNLSNSTNSTDHFRNISSCELHEEPRGRKYLLTMILMISTFLISVYSHKVKHSQYFSIKVRLLLSDCGVFLAVVIVFCFDLLVEDTYLPRLEMKNDWSDRSTGWFASLRKDSKAKNWLIIFAAVPAFLVVIILYMETLVTGVALSDKRNRLKKGSGSNLDLLVVGVLVTVSSLLGLPWMCACPVHSMSHLNSLSMISTHHAPGTKPFITHVIEQRVTNIIMHLMIGFTIFLAPLLRGIPVAIPFGVFLWLGVTSLTRLRMMERTKLLLIPASYHPDVSYVRKVKTKQIHKYTLIQLACLAILVAIKNTILAPCFPFFVLLMIPLRVLGLKRVFKEDELEALDGNQEHAANVEDLEEYEGLQPTV